MPTRRLFVATLAAVAAPPGALAQSGAHPADDYRRAAQLFQSGDRDGAVYWLYRGQYRYRAHLAARPDLRRDGDPALFASLNESIGRPINEYGFGDIPRLLQTLDRVIGEARANDDAFTPKARYAAAHQTILNGLVSMRAQVEREQDQIRAQRVRNGLVNRTQ